ncbi:ABC-type Fe3+/spermidine/putrescine transport system ATPase subunit [Methylobacterium fujisawaense]|uniref:ABC-type Fe3+/spermidine/putrescine transport system ATPase subunit n=1 Tax=Methylobacterium fujisawaense TaxID=107400 RepID=A0ABR6D849_9HYPH|nr:ABC-type Fe3+/spermidine/putrescine transport system ATPase subunit [Methylobacterium fujisawaense]
MLRLAQLWQDFQQFRLSVDRLGDILNTPVEPGFDGVKQCPPPLRGHIRFEGVGFRYRPGGPEILRGLDVEIQPGEVVGIVGRSGSGKSTLTKLLQRPYLPERGRVLVDGIDVGLLDPSGLRRQIGVMLQENVLFARTIRENIALADPGGSPAFAPGREAQMRWVISSARPVGMSCRIYAQPACALQMKYPSNFSEGIGIRDLSKFFDAEQSVSSLGKGRALHDGGLAAPVLVPRDDAAQEPGQGALLRRGEGLDGQGVRGPRRRLHRAVERGPRFGQPTDLRAAVEGRGRAAHQAARREAFQGAGRRRPVEGDRAREGRLIGLLQVPQQRQQAVLQRSDAKRDTAFRKKADVDLVHAAGEEARALAQGPVPRVRRPVRLCRPRRESGVQALIHRPTPQNGSSLGTPRATPDYEACFAFGKGEVGARRPGPHRRSPRAGHLSRWLRRTGQSGFASARTTFSPGGTRWRSPSEDTICFSCAMASGS